MAKSQEKQATAPILYPHAVIYGTVGESQNTTGAPVKRNSNQPTWLPFSNLPEFLWAAMSYWLCLEEIKQNNGFWTLLEDGSTYYISYEGKKVTPFRKDQTVPGVVGEILERGENSITQLKINAAIRKLCGIKKTKDSVAEDTVKAYEEPI